MKVSVPSEEGRLTIDAIEYVAAYGSFRNGLTIPFNRRESQFALSVWICSRILGDRGRRTMF